MNKIGLAGAAVAIALGFNAEAASSFYSAPMFTPDYLMLQGNWQRLDAANERIAKGGGNKGAAGNGASTAPLDLTYRRDPKLAMDINAKVVETVLNMFRKSGQLTREREAEIRKNFGSRDVSQTFSKQISNAGMQPHDMVTALTMYAMIGYDILSDGRGTSAAQNRALNTHLKSAFAQTPEIAKMNNAARQRFAESLYWLAYLQGVDFALAQKGTPGKSTAEIKADVRRAMKSFRIDPDVYALTAQGLVRK